MDPAKEIFVRSEVPNGLVQAIQLPTVTAAELSGMKDSIGTIETGTFADIVAVPGYPLTDIAVLERWIL